MKTDSLTQAEVLLMQARRVIATADDLTHEAKFMVNNPILQALVAIENLRSINDESELATQRRMEEAGVM